MTSHPFPKHALIALLLAFFAFFMSALISRTVFDRLPHLEDEVAYLYQAKTYAGGNLVIPTPQPQRAYWMPFLVDQGGNQFGKYTPGWSMQLALGVLMGQTWIINAFYALLTVGLVYRLGREIFNPDVGVIAAALTAFSPMALLLDGTLMGHTSALFAATLFLYAYWRIERGSHTLSWGAVAGIALGILVANRPITGIALAVPLILWSLIRLLRGFAHDLARLRSGIKRQEVSEFKPTSENIDPKPASFELAADDLEADPEPVVTRRVFAPAGTVPVHGVIATFSPLIILSLFTILIASIVPINNYMAVGNPGKDLYTLVWSYDQIGFGAANVYGRSGHTIGKGINQARFDLSLTASDLFGWQLGSMTEADGTVKPALQDHLLNRADYWLEIGLSWILLPLAFLVAYRRKAIFIVIWVAAAYGWVLFALKFQNGAQLPNPVFSWLWVITALIWLYLPLVFWRDRVRAWTWILWSVAIGLVVMQMAYWIGSQLYSTRYFFEGLTSIAIISALPIAWLARRINRPLVYGLLALALAYSLYFYSTPRISVLKSFNFITPNEINGVQARRTGSQPVLVVINGSNVRWRAFGPLMAVTSPYLNSDIVVAWNYDGDDGPTKQKILARFPDRQVIEMNADNNYWWFEDQVQPTETSTGGGGTP